MSQVNGLLTSFAALTQVELNYFFTASALSGTPTPSTTYIFLGKPDAWNDDLNPPIPTEDQATIKQTFKNMFAAKLLTASDLSPVVPRFDWTANTVYTPYSDKVDILEYDSNGILKTQFYVRNSFDQIFKCLSNNNDGPSTVEPRITPGNTNTGQVLGNLTVLADGYKWIYVTTIDKGLKQRFFDNNWIPVAIGINTPNTLGTAGFGTVDAVNLVTGGNNYTNGTATTTVTISGDGSGATAYANVVSNTVQNIVVTNPGSNYSYATVSITSLSANGSGATANAVISPIGGHGFDPVSELGCNHIMLSVEFDGSENGAIPSNNIAFRQVGVLVNPLTTTGEVPTGTVYNTADIATLNFGSPVNSFVSGETVYQGTAVNPTFTATVSGFDVVNNLLSLINTLGTFSIGSTITGQSSGASRILLNYTRTGFDVGSGYLYYYENRQPVVRTPTDNQQVRLVSKF